MKNNYEKNFLNSNIRLRDSKISDSKTVIKIIPYIKESEKIPRSYRIDKDLLEELQNISVIDNTFVIGESQLVRRAIELLIYEYYKREDYQEKINLLIGEFDRHSI